MSGRRMKSAVSICCRLGNTPSQAFATVAALQMLNGPGVVLESKEKILRISVPCSTASVWPYCTTTICYLHGTVERILMQTKNLSHWRMLAGMVCEMDMDRRAAARSKKKLRGR